MDDWEPQDTQAKSIRFGCGFLFGGVVLSLALARHFFSFASPYWITVAVGAVICGLLAIRYGNRFYEWAASLFRWW